MLILLIRFPKNKDYTGRKTSRVINLTPYKNSSSISK